MYKKIKILLGVGIFLFIQNINSATNNKNASHKNIRHKNIEYQFIKDYTQLVYLNYLDSYNDALLLQKKVKQFLSSPTSTSFTEVKKAWLHSRDSYSQTEAFRFYEGPIDFVDEKNGEEGPEGRLNSWPINEAYIDYVKGNLKTGIIQNVSIPLSKKSLLARNQSKDEVDVSIGYHAIEFLLWGQDLSLQSPGQRPVSDFYSGDPIRNRRRQYLKITTEILVEDLKFLVDSWSPNRKNYAQQFQKQAFEESLADILSSLATLSAFELASERMGTALDSGDQEDEHSCFSDNTHHDFIFNALGIQNVYLGKYENQKFQGIGIYDLLKTKDKVLAENIKTQLEITARLIADIPFPIDREVLSKPKKHKARQKMEQAITSLQKQAELFQKAGKILETEVEIIRG